MHRPLRAFVVRAPKTRVGSRWIEESTAMRAVVNGEEAVRETSSASSGRYVRDVDSSVGRVGA